MKKFALQEVLLFAQPLLLWLATNRIPYLIYGSIAQNLYAENSSALVSDLDIIVSEKDFSSIMKNQTKFEKYYQQVVKTPFNIFFNEEIFEVNKVTKSISLDSLEHYFQTQNTNMDDFEICEWNNLKLRLLKRNKLKNLYREYGKKHR